jgi:hypothetical protein
LAERSEPILKSREEDNASVYHSGKFADLKIVKIPDGSKWEIEEYDGLEHVSEQHQTWG